MNDFRTIAKTGPDFVNIIFEQAADDVDNIIIEVFVDDMKMKTFVCEGDYHYKVSQISNSEVKVAENIFTITKNDVSSDNKEDDVYLILNIYAQILEKKGGWIYTSYNEQPIQIMKGTEIIVKGGNLVFNKTPYLGHLQTYCIPFHGIQYITHDL